MEDSSFFDLGRFTDPSLLILTSLAGGPKHGYAMLEDIENFANVKLGPGTLYGALARLEQRGLIAAIDRDNRRRPYRLTATGATTLRDHLASLDNFTRAGLERIKAL